MRQKTKRGIIVSLHFVSGFMIIISGYFASDKIEIPREFKIFFWIVLFLYAIPVMIYTFKNIDVFPLKSMETRNTRFNLLITVIGEIIFMLIMFFMTKY